MILDCLLFFLAGALQDVLITSYQRYVAVGYKLVAALLSATIAVISVLVISRIAVRIQEEHLPLVAYAAGKILGTYGSLKYLKISISNVSV